MSINITVELSNAMKKWLSEEQHTTAEIVKHIGYCPFFNDRGHHPIKYVEVRLLDRHVCCVSNDDGTVLKEIPDDLSAEVLAEWIGIEMLSPYEIFHEACDYSDIFTL